MTNIEMKDALPLTAVELRRMNAYWRDANYLSVGQIYLYDNPLRREPSSMLRSRDDAAVTFRGENHDGIQEPEPQL